MDAEVAVVRGQAFDHPETLRVHLVLVVKGTKLDRTESLDVPGVKQLVADECQPSQITRTRSGVPAAAHQDRRVTMLEPAAGLCDHIEDEVPVIRHYAPHLVDLAGNQLDVLRRLRTVPYAGLTEVHQQVRRAVDRELIEGRGTGDDRRVDQRVVVGRAIGVRATVGPWCETGHTPVPAGRQLEGDIVRAECVVIGEGEKRRCAVEHGEISLDPVRADRHLPSIHQVGHDDAVGAAGRHAPAVLAGLLDRQRPTRRCPGGNRFDLASELTDEIGAGGPDGHHQLDLCTSPGRHTGLDADIVCVWRGKP